MNQGFYMKSYLMYTIVSMKSWAGLNPYGEYNVATQIYNYYPQLQVKKRNAHFHRVNDAFSMLTAKGLHGDIGLQISPKTTSIMSTYGSLIFCNFITFT